MVRQSTTLLIDIGEHFLCRAGRNEKEAMQCYMSKKICTPSKAEEVRDKLLAGNMQETVRKTVFESDFFWTEMP